MISIDELTIDQVHSAYKQGSHTCRQLVEAYIERIKTLDQAGPKLNAITTISPFALEEADFIDTHFKEHGKFIGSLHGVPVIVKDQCDTKGVETTYGNICCKHIPSQDATLVRKLRDAGAVILAKSTMPDFAASFNSASSVSGETLNPYDTTRETGGSSAGTGAAIAANYGLIGVGEDTGGSIRVPASFCNLVGLRPTVGLVSRFGLSPLVKTQDTPGPMTRTVKDAALMLDVLVGYDSKDTYTAAAAIAGPPRGGSYASNLSKYVLSRARIGVLNAVFGEGEECAPVNQIIRDTLSKFTAGTTLIDVDIPNLDYYLNFSSTYFSRSRYDIDNFLSAHPIIKNVTVESIHKSKQFHQALPLFDRIGTGPKHPYEDAHYAARLDERDEFQRIVIGIMTEHNLDAIAYPSVQIPAPTIKDVLGPRFKENPFLTNTTIGSQLRQPAISVPVGFTEPGLPVGLELLGMPYSEQKLLELAYGVEVLTKARRAPKFAS
ncbi:amidase family protein [Mollisia scopiformis]|uniref:Amidase family protein n=1 Tax=Mollisia scopiformis TaxID=149040 RepID=A0A132B538_MOLSC|nr:amidase family protein [Mollisia scopiformis]KUJ07451.1 amidase family protein [Mollisia scopiformis]